MPSAVLNWLALAGWGTGSGSAATEATEGVVRERNAPDSTQMLSLDELINKVRSTLHSF